MRLCVCVFMCFRGWVFPCKSINFSGSFVYVLNDGTSETEIALPLQHSYYRQREVVVKIAFLQSFENQNESIHQSSNPPKSGYNRFQAAARKRKEQVIWKRYVRNKWANSSAAISV